MPTRPTAIVTGAGSGIGRATALLLADAGFDLVIVSRRSATLQETARQVAARAPQAKCHIESADLTDTRAPRRVADAALEHQGRIDVLCNIAGYADFTAIGDITPEEWRATVDTNLSATVLMTAAVWPTFARQNAGFIANVSSMASVDPFPHFAMYAACKAAVNMFTRCAADEGEAVGVKTVCVAPGAVETPMLRAIMDEAAIARDKTLAPEDVARVIVDCATATRPLKSGDTILLPSP